MKYQIAIVAFLLGFLRMDAQINELGVFLGGSNFIGDVGRTDYIHPNEFAFGVLYKWNRSTRHSYRISYKQSKLTARDIDSDVPGRNMRNYDFENTVREFALGFEFNFFDFDLHDLDPQFTPYVWTGVSYFIYDELYHLETGYEKDYTSSTFAIPMAVGVKGSITPKLVLGFEVGARYTFTDNIDGSNPENKNLEPLRFGNINSKDWYVFTGFTLTYTFTEKPCFCAD
jgi:hypothetical protein